MSIQFINKGRKAPVLQEKDLTITSNGTTTVTSDTGYDGLSEVEIITNVSAGGKTVLPDGICFRGSAFTTFNANIFNFSNITTANSMLRDCKSLITADFSNIDFSNVTSMAYMFNSCTNLTSVNFSNIITGNVTDLSVMFSGCSNLTTIDFSNFDLSGCISSNPLTSLFQNCTSLSNESLNSILKGLCSSNQSSRKTLKQCGLTAEQATTCTTLSNYQDFLAAGWTTGY